MSDGGGEDTNVGGEWSADELIPFGKYVLLDRLSSGATASVYRANVRGEAGFERLVAIKRILPHMAGDRDFVDTFVREAKTVARLTHATICPIYELGKVGESLYMAIEYISGKDLGSIMRLLARRGEAVPPVIAAWIAARLCEALDYAHNLKNARGDRKGIIHRDLSPSNVIISYEGQVKLIDFGLAKAVGRAQSTNVSALKMKIGYMSPEMVKGKPLDGRSDLFGVGVCLYEMITGRRLFVGANDIEALKLVGNASVPPPSAVTDDTPEELELVIMRALQRDPSDRYQEAADMGEALTAYLRKTDQTFGLTQLSQWMAGLFGAEIEEERAHVTRLLAASNDPDVLIGRRTFFASPSGAAARARAEIERRLSTEPPPARAPGPHIPKTSGIPREATDAPIVSSLPPPVPGSSVPPPRDGEPPIVQTGFEDEPTAYYGDKPGGFEDEPTQYLTDGDVEVVDTGGFDEEATSIFFNKEEGVGLSEMLDEINDVERPAPLNRPIIAPELGLAAPAGALPGSPMVSLAPSPLPARTVSSVPTPQPAPRTVAPRPVPMPDAFEEPPAQPRTWPIAAGFVVLFAVIGALLVMTPLGVALRLRPAPAGAIELRTNPQIPAAVHLDDVYRGTTPLRLSGVQPGLRRVRFVAEGYVEVYKEIAVQSGGTALIEVALIAKQPAPPKPIEPTVVAAQPALPPAALTPAAPSAPAPPPATGSNGRRRARRSSEPGSSEGTGITTEVSSSTPVAAPVASPVAASGGGTLVVNSVPWAYVIIDGRETGRTTPLMGYTLSPGPHEIQLRTAMGQIHVQRIDVQPGQTVRVSRRF